MQVLRLYNDITVVIAARIHLFPFRTEKLSSLAPMVLHCVVGEQVAATFQRRTPLSRFSFFIAISPSSSPSVLYPIQSNFFVLLFLCFLFLLLFSLFMISSFFYCFFFLLRYSSPFIVFPLFLYLFSFFYPLSYYSSQQITPGPFRDLQSFIFYILFYYTSYQITTGSFNNLHEVLLFYPSFSNTYSIYIFVSFRFFFGTYNPQYTVSYFLSTPLPLILLILFSP